MATSNNVVKFNHPSGRVAEGFSSSDIENLLSKHIHPAIDSTLSTLLDELLQSSESATSNQQISHYRDAYLLIKSSLSTLKKNYIKELKRAKKSPEINNENPCPLSLIDNDELEKRLINQVSAQALIIEDATQLLVNLSNRVSEKKDLLLLISPENICSSFSRALSSLSIPMDIEEKCLSVLSHTMKLPAYAMWEEADHILAAKGFKLPELSKQPADEPAIAKETQNSSPTETMLLETITNNVLGKVEALLSKTVPDNQADTPQAPEATINSTELAVELSSIQSQLVEKLTSIEDLTKTIKDTLESQKIDKKLSRQHHDLINMVGMLFEYILDDHELHPEVRKLISLLQIPILKLAILDQDFLGNRHHPARLLLNEMTAAGMKCDDTTTLDTPVIGLIEETVRYLITEIADTNSKHVEAFSIALERFHIALEAIQIQNNNTENDPAASNEILDEFYDDSPSQNTNRTTPKEEATEEEIVLESDWYREHHFHTHLSSQAHTHSKGYFQPVEGLEIGHWVEFVGTSSQRLRCKLCHIDEFNDRYTFVNQSDMKIAEKQGDELRRAVKEGTLNILHNTPLFEKALKTVLDKFKRH